MSMPRMGGGVTSSCLWARMGGGYIVMSMG